MRPRRDSSSSAKTHPTILVVDDEPDITDLIKFHLEKESYTVKTVNDPLQVINQIRNTKPDLIILDVMMPEINGFQLCRIIKADPAMEYIKIVFLTGKTDSDDRIRGLEIGSDDYICKPFETRELCLRVANIFKRSKPNGSHSEYVLRAGNIELMVREHCVKCSGKIVSLTSTEFSLLRCLLERRGRVQSRDDLLENVWNYSDVTQTRTIDTHIRRLRSKLGDDANIIETVRGIGYVIR